MRIIEHTKHQALATVAYYATFMPDGQATLLYAARRDWGQKNATAAKAFREAIQAAAAFIRLPMNDGSSGPDRSTTAAWTSWWSPD